MILLKRTESHLPYVVRSSSTIQENILGRLKILRPVWYRSLGPADEFAGTRTGAILFSILVKIYEFVQGSKGDRSEIEIGEMLSFVDILQKLFRYSVSNLTQRISF